MLASLENKFTVVMQVFGIAKVPIMPSARKSVVKRCPCTGLSYRFMEARIIADFACFSYFSAPKTFLTISLVAPSGLERKAFSCSPIMKYRPSSDFCVT